MQVNPFNEAQLPLSYKQVGRLNKEDEKNKMSPKRQTTAFILKQILYSSNSVISREDVFCKRALRDSHRGNTHCFVSQKI